MLNTTELGAYIDDRLTRSAFRLETLALYDVESNGSDFERFMAGETSPTPGRKQAWLERLSREAAAGIRNHRVHTLSRPLTDYLRFECEWGYVYNAAAGEEIGILDVTDRQAPSGLADHDFWLIDDEHAIRMYYDDQGRYVGAEPTPELLDAYRHARDVAVASAVPFVQWWREHVEEHQANVSA